MMQILFVYVNDRSLPEPVQINFYNNKLFCVEDNQLNIVENLHYSSYLYNGNVKSITAIIGKNGSGKSLILEALMTIFDNDDLVNHFIIYEENDKLYFHSMVLDISLKKALLSKKIKAKKMDCDTYIYSNIIDSSERFLGLKNSGNLTLKKQLIHSASLKQFQENEFLSELNFVLKYYSDVDEIMNLPSSVNFSFNTQIVDFFDTKYLEPFKRKLEEASRKSGEVNRLLILLREQNYTKLDRHSFEDLIDLTKIPVEYLLFKQRKKKEGYPANIEEKSENTAKKKKEISLNEIKDDAEIAKMNQEKQEEEDWYLMINNYFVESLKTMLTREKRKIDNLDSKIESLTSIKEDLYIIAVYSTKSELLRSSKYLLYCSFMDQLLQLFESLTNNPKTLKEDQNEKKIDWEEDFLKLLRGFGTYSFKKLSQKKVLEKLALFISNKSSKIEKKVSQGETCEDDLFTNLNLESKDSFFYLIVSIFYTSLSLEDNFKYDQQINPEKERILVADMFSGYLATTMQKCQDLLELITNSEQEANVKSESEMSIELKSPRLEEVLAINKNFPEFVNPLLHNWRDLSSGEYALLNLFSNLPEERAIASKNIILAIDEGELYFHQDLQTRFISILESFLSKMFPNKTVQIILTSHSPFIVSDIPHSDVNLLENKRLRRQSDDLLTFGSNIQEILYSSFYMKHGMVGAYAKNKINQVFSHLEQQTTISSVEYEEIKIFSSLIGERLVRNRLELMLQQKKEVFYTKEEEISYLEKRLGELRHSNE